MADRQAEACPTALEYDKVVVAEIPKPAGGARETPANVIASEPPKRVATAPAFPDLAVRKAKGDEPDNGPVANPAGKTYSFDVSLGSGPNPFTIRGSFTVSPAGSEESPKGR